LRGDWLPLGVSSSDSYLLFLALDETLARTSFFLVSHSLMRVSPTDSTTWKSSPLNHPCISSVWLLWLWLMIMPTSIFSSDFCLCGGRCLELSCSRLRDRRSPQREHQIRPETSESVYADLDATSQRIIWPPITVHQLLLLPSPTLIIYSALAIIGTSKAVCSAATFFMICGCECYANLL
jgi:hypothetical protein